VIRSFSPLSLSDLKPFRSQTRHPAAGRQKRDLRPRPLPSSRFITDPTGQTSRKTPERQPLSPNQTFNPFCPFKNQKKGGGRRPNPNQIDLPGDFREPSVTQFTSKFQDLGEKHQAEERKTRTEKARKGRRSREEKKGIGGRNGKRGRIRWTPPFVHDWPPVSVTVCTYVSAVIVFQDRTFRSRFVTISPWEKGKKGASISVDVVALTIFSPGQRFFLFPLFPLVNFCVSGLGGEWSGVDWTGTNSGPFGRGLWTTPR
jgi:hypothetical protein